MFPKICLTAAINFLSEEIDLLIDDKEQIVTVEIPLFVQLKVIETEPGFKGR